MDYVYLSFKLGTVGVIKCVNYIFTQNPKSIYTDVSAATAKYLMSGLTDWMVNLSNLGSEYRLVVETSLNRIMTE